MKIGPMSKVMGMLPGIGQMMGAMGGMGDDEVGASVFLLFACSSFSSPPDTYHATHPIPQRANRIKRLLYMMDSMTDEELDGKVDIEKSDSRILRIARGSGAHPEEVVALLDQHKQFADMFKKMSKSGITKVRTVYIHVKGWREAHLNGTMRPQHGDKQMAQQMQRNPMHVMQGLTKSMNPQ